ncbi:MAG: 3' terminal RNA ribose 2'-O-methyltransferase Hen1 [Oscillospiraceae bacterium]|nr:3' terminal RNA ribose 2'-O-methyltransferase Hen1 [Oscillospiraceae bacterium]
MLLTISYEGKQTQDLGYLLYKHPDKIQSFVLSYGKAWVCYPEVSDEKTTVALLLDLNPIELARGKLGSKDGGLFDYVNDRPYVASSFMSTAISRVFGTAMSGRCDTKQALADSKLKLTACVYLLHDNNNENLAKEIFEPLGYAVKTERMILDERFPEWGNSPYTNLEISGLVKLSDLLKHLYVLIPVFDKQKHYYVSEDEIHKLLSHGEGWLAEHPAKDKIVYRYLHQRKSYAHKAIDKLSESDNMQPKLEKMQINSEESAKKKSLNQQRLEAVKQAVLDSKASSVIDLGCGECKLTSLLLNEPQIKKITACDVSVKALEKAVQKLHYDTMPEYRKNKLNLIQGSLIYQDKRFSGYDCACIVEVIEHIELSRLPAFEHVVFEFAQPKTVIITTPNREYNVNYEFLPQDELRHDDHRFEWTRKEFQAWTKHICETFHYVCNIQEIGESDKNLGTPTQMGVFQKCE